MILLSNNMHFLRAVAGVCVSALTAASADVRISSVAILPILLFGQAVAHALPCIAAKYSTSVADYRRIVLNLNHKELTEAPDMKRFPSITILTIMNNEIETLPDLSENEDLSSLYFSNNRLSSAPDTTHNPDLRLLDLTRNCITHPPDVRNNHALTLLHISHNKLISAPDLTENLLLEFLDLAGNEITVSPDLTQNLALSSLNLSFNHLTEAPDLSQNTGLDHVDLSYNQISQAPELCPNSAISNLNLSGNLLTSLPDSYLSLPFDCTIDVTGNRFSSAYVEAFERQLADQRLLDPNTGPEITFSVYDEATSIVEVNTLPEELAEWEASFSSDIDYEVLLQIDYEPQAQVVRFLNKLKRTADYINEGTRVHLTARIERMLRLSCLNEGFRLVMLSIMQDADRTCGDGIILLFNNIEAQCLIFDKDYSESELMDVAADLQRYELVKDLAKKKAKELRLGDEAQIILYYSIKLKNVLNLPVSTDGMLYPAMASAITQDMLDDATRFIRLKSKLELLSISELWRSHLQKSNPDLFTAADALASEQIENLSKEATSQVHLNAIDVIIANRESNFSQITLEATLPKFSD